eukprot:scaffold76447_cov58-Phaeocystis_antarctica.AAC.2
MRPPGSCLHCGSPSAHHPSQVLGQTPLIVLRLCSMQMPPPRAQLSRRSTANDDTMECALLALAGTMLNTSTRR